MCVSFGLFEIDLFHKTAMERLSIHMSQQPDVTAGLSHMILIVFYCETVFLQH